VKVCQSIGHEKYRRGVAHSLLLIIVLKLLLLMFRLAVILPSFLRLRFFGFARREVVPEFDFSKECFHVRSFVCALFEVVDPILFGENRVAPR
jgi:hypothetical protein